MPEVVGAPGDSPSAVVTVSENYKVNLRSGYAIPSLTIVAFAVAIASLFAWMFCCVLCFLPTIAALIIDYVGLGAILLFIIICMVLANANMAV